MLVKAISVSFENSIPNIKEPHLPVFGKLDHPFVGLDVRPLTARIPMSAGRFLHAVAPPPSNRPSCRYTLAGEHQTHTVTHQVDVDSRRVQVVNQIVLNEFKIRINRTELICFRLQIDKHSGFRGQYSPSSQSTFSVRCFLMFDSMRGVHQQTFLRS
ncbi:hypothetical protein CEXT_188551 [Caerostris extrusa]|uniref:Uncharacterized protein n=1 Tax=Caerostris extrusa TaxID=172846 RepID=A0AAV4U9X4_CAEEX|nr:hypothetical protein CEXT_188551 [Caerostris extrusa]